MSSYIFLDFDKQDALNVEKVKNELEGADEKIKELDASTQQCIGIKNELDTLNQNSITTKDQLIQNNTLAETNNNNLIKNNKLAQTNIQALIQQNVNITELGKTLDTKLTNGNQVSQDLETKSENANNINLELEKNISNGNQLNTNLTTSIDDAKKVMTDTTFNLINSKNKELQDSIKTAEDFSKTLKDGTDFVQMRKDIDTLENGLKNNQMLSYSGSNITCKNSLEGRTSGLKLYGRTLQNFALASNYVQKQDGSQAYFSWDLNYSAGQYTVKNTTGKKIVIDINKDNKWVRSEMPTETSIITLNEGEKISNMQFLKMNGFVIDDNIKKQLLENLVILKGNYLDIIDNLNYFEGIKSVGEAEGNKISILSTGQNLFDGILELGSIDGNGVNTDDSTRIRTKNYINVKSFKNIYISSGENCTLGIRYYDNNKKVISSTTIAINNVGKIFNDMPLDTAYIRFSVVNSVNLNIKFFITSNQINFDKYEPYKEYKKEIQLQQPFAGLKDVQDTIEETDQGVIYTQNIGKRAYQTGDENLENVMTDKMNTYYVLDKPIKTILKGIEETDIDTYNIITYVKSLNSIPCVIDFSIATNYGSLLMQHSQEINRIWDTIYNIVYPVITENAVEISKAQAKNLLN